MCQRRDVTHVKRKTIKKRGKDRSEGKGKDQGRYLSSCTFLNLLLSLPVPLVAFEKEQAQGGPVRYDHQRQQQDENVRHGSTVEFKNRALETHARDKQVDAHRGQRGPDFKVGQKNDPQMSGVNAIRLGDRKDHREHYDQGRKHAQDTAGCQEEDIEPEQEGVGALNVTSHEIEESTRNLFVDEAVGQAKRNPKYNQNAPHKNAALDRD